jgi:Holliday junction DNA helicase RuvA
MVIAGIEGTLKSIEDDSVIVEVGSVSLRLLTPASTLGVLGPCGSRVQLHTHLQVREESMALYGFASAEELRLFQLLITVSGIGPRLALSVLSGLSPERFALAVASGDTGTLSSIPGVGKKTAARIALELKGQFEKEELGLPYPHEDVKSALMGLGFSVAEATEAIAALPNPSDLPLEDKLKVALKHLSRVS